MSIGTVGRAVRLVDTPKDPRFVDITGQTFGRLQVIGYMGKARNNHSLWLCRCDCGNTAVVRGSCLRTGVTRSCGCLAKEVASKTHRIHGRAKTRLYAAWKAMRQRCYDKDHPGYHNYGGRGIRVCERWQSFENFAEDMGPSFRPGLSLDRIDVNGDYEPGNCRWATRQEQANNTRANRTVVIHGEILTIAQAARRIGIRPNVVHKRIHNGWSVYDALFTPLGGKRGDRS